MTQVRVMHYLNQFFAGIGGEEKADVPPDFREGSVGPGKRLQGLLGDSANIVTLYLMAETSFIFEAAARLHNFNQRNHFRIIKVPGNPRQPPTNLMRNCEDIFLSAARNI